MKTRSGFVSNSSSSSFILYGAMINMSRVAQKVMELASPEELTALTEETDIDEITVDLVEDCLRDCCWSNTGIKALDDAGLEVRHYDDDYLGFDIGVSRSSLINGHGFTEEELDQIDEVLRQFTGSTGSVHEGEYYC